MATTTSEDEDVCALCLCNYNNPYYLPCGNFHMVCLDPCLKDLIRHNRAHHYFDCPMCRSRIAIPAGGAEAFERVSADLGNRTSSHTPRRSTTPARGSRPPFAMRANGRFARPRPQSSRDENGVWTIPRLPGLVDDENWSNEIQQQARLLQENMRLQDEIADRHTQRLLQETGEQPQNRNSVPPSQPSAPQNRRSEPAHQSPAPPNRIPVHPIRFNIPQNVRNARRNANGLFANFLAELERRPNALQNEIPAPQNQPAALHNQAAAHQQTTPQPNARETRETEGERERINVVGGRRQALEERRREKLERIQDHLRRKLQIRAEKESRKQERLAEKEEKKREIQERKRERREEKQQRREEIRANREARRLGLH